MSLLSKPAPVPAAHVVDAPVQVAGFNSLTGFYDHDRAYKSILGIGDAVVKYRQGESETVVWLDPDKTKDLSPLQKLVLADGAPSPLGGVVAGNRVTVYRD